MSVVNVVCFQVEAPCIGLITRPGESTTECGMSSIGATVTIYEGWNFNSGNYLFTTDTK